MSSSSATEETQTTRTPTSTPTSSSSSSPPVPQKNIIDTASPSSSLLEPEQKQDSKIQQQEQPKKCSSSSNNNNDEEFESAEDEEAKNPKVSPLTSLIAGFMAGTVSRTATAPLDRIKVLAQEGRVQMKRKLHPTVHVVEDKKKKPVNLRQTAALVYRDGGMKSFWRGNGANCLKAGPELGLVFSFRNLLMDLVRPWTHCEVDFMPSLSFLPHFSQTQRTITANFLTSAAAGFGAQIIVYPLETTKTRIAVATSGEYSSILDCVVQSYNRGGVKDFYKGIVANLTGIVPYRGLEIGCFFTLQNAVISSRLAYFHKLATTNESDIAPGHRYRHDEAMNMTAEEYSQLSLMEVAGVGVAASVFAQTLTYPLNLVRTRMQTQGVNGRPKIYKSMSHCFQTIWRTDGFVGLFRGLGANFLKAVPASVLTFMIVDRFQRFVANRTKNLAKLAANAKLLEQQNQQQQTAAASSSSMKAIK